MAKELILLVVSDRPLIRALFAGLGEHGPQPFRVLEVPASGRALWRHPEYVAGASVAVVDLMPDPYLAVAACRHLYRQRPDLPVAALVCCPYSAAHSELQAAMRAGADSVLDLELTGEEMVRALRAIARGNVVLHLHVSGEHDESSRQVITGTGDEALTLADLDEADRELVELLAEGLPDEEIGRHMALSLEAVSDRVEQLCDRLGVRNRIELVALFSSYRRDERHNPNNSHNNSAKNSNGAEPH